MTSGNGTTPPGTAEKSLGEIVNEVTEKATLLVREEIELAKAEMQQKLTRIAKGAAVGVVGGVFLGLALIYFLHALSWFWDDLFNWSGIWLGYLVTTGILVVLGAIAGLLAVRFFKKGTPAAPQMAIEEAKKTREVLEEARS
ncbi:MAG TPA: phage holin family protein [Thermoleophilaceae bacterium]|nr:phage holin family protein [Thermoleophilaceae bacterium]